MDALYALLNSASEHRQFTRTEKETAISLFAEMHGIIQTRRHPEGFRLASGEIARGATGRIALNAYFQLLGRLALGAEYVEKDERFRNPYLRLGWGIMQSHFTRGYERGFYCCPTCTFSVLPLYCVHAFREFDCELLKQNMLKAIRNREGRFKAHFSRHYADWALRFARS